MSDTRAVFFFDIDNCLYSRNTKVLEATDVLIHQFFKTGLSVDDVSAENLRLEYRNGFGLIVEGLAANHGIDPLDFNRQVDDALPLDDLIKPDPELYRLLQDIDRTKVKLWLFTNAYKNHAKRVTRLLGLEDCFEGLTYCDYGTTPLRCKPHVEMFVKAMNDAGIYNTEACYFIDDSSENCRQAELFGWNSIHFLEENIQPAETYVCRHTVRHLRELRCLLPQFFNIRMDNNGPFPETVIPSNLDIVKIADAFPYPEEESTTNHYCHFRVASHPEVTLGYILLDIVLTLDGVPDWVLDLSSNPKTVTMITGDDNATRSAVMDKTTRAMRASGRFKLLDKWRDELFPVYGPNSELLFSMERSACPLFGVVVYGINMTAFHRTTESDGRGSLKIWVSRRSNTRAKFPGMLDTLVGGGLSTGETPWSCLIRESEEEASLKEDVVRSAQEVGTITYFYVSGEGSGGEISLAQPECSYVFDLDLTGFPSNSLVANDGSVAAFASLTVAELKIALRRKEFKPNCALVMFDFLIRHGQLTAEEEPDIQEISQRVRRKLDFPLREL